MLRQVFVLFALPIAALLLRDAAAQQDELTLQDGTRIQHCYVRDDGRVLRVWRSKEEFPGGGVAIPRDDIKSFKIRRGLESDWHEREPIQDLSVTHLEVDPPLVGLHGCYDYDRFGAPVLRPRLHSRIEGRIDPSKAKAAIRELGDANRIDPSKALSEDLKLAYANGEKLRLIAHVKNTGFATAQPFAWRLLLNGKEAASGTWPGRLEEMQIARIEHAFAWPGGDPVARFEVTPGTREIAAFNNVREDTLSGWGFDYLTTHRRVAYMHRYRNALGSFSWEDYYQWHLDLMNELFAQSVYPSAPEGIQARVRLNRIFYLDEVDDESIERTLLGEDGLIRNQGGWYFRDNPNEKQGKWWLPDGNFNGCVTEWSLPHELGHQLGLIDLYRTDYHGREGFEVVGRDMPLRFSHFFRHPRVMMHWHGPHLWSESTAGYLNASKGKPRGIYGDYVFSTPEHVQLLVTDINGRPLAGKRLRIFQRGAPPIAERVHEDEHGTRWWEVPETGHFPDRFFAQPGIVGTTDELGLLRLPNRPVQPAQTLNAYVRKPNPFGNINVVGERHLMLVLVDGERRSAPFFVELNDLNNAVLRGQTGTVTLPLRTDFGGDFAPPAPKHARLVRGEGDSWRLEWERPEYRPATAERAVHRYRIYRRVASEGLNFEPWDPVMTVPEGQFAAALPPLLSNPSYAVGHRRDAYGISSINERGVESDVVALYAPDVRRVRALLRQGAGQGEGAGRGQGDEDGWLLGLQQESSVARIVREGLYEDATPLVDGLDKPGESWAQDGKGRFASAAWDRHCVVLFDRQLRPVRVLGKPWTPGGETNRLRHPRDVALATDGRVAIADEHNGRVLLFAAADAWKPRGAGPDAVEPCLILKELDGHRPLRVALGNRILAVLLDDARVLIFALSKDSRTARQLSVLNGLGHEADLRIDAEDSIWALVRHRARIVRFDSAGNLLGEYARLGETELRRPQGLVLLPGGELAVFNDQSRVLRGKPGR
jgi:hypothetical protein